MAETHHGWLFEPGTWLATGVFRERGEVAREARGASVIRHGEETWEVEGVPELSGETPVRFQNGYVITPPPRRGARVIPWQSHNPAVGMLTGVFAVAGERIMSLFRSTDHEYAGSECLTQLASDRYRACGLFASSSEVLSSWSMELVRA